MAGEQTSQAGTTTEEAFRAILRTFGLIRRNMEPYFSGYGISGAQWGVLRVLHRAQEEGQDGLRLTDLGSRLLVRPPSVTTVVDRLERQGLVDRRASTTDRRAKTVSLSAAGRELVCRILEAHPERIRSILGGLNIEEQAQLLALLGRLETHLEGLLEQLEREESEKREAQAVGEPSSPASKSG